MKTLVVLLSSLFASTIAFADELPAAVAELAVHKIEKLVLTKKIEKTYGTNLQTISLEPLTQSAPTDPAYKTTGFQVPAEDQTKKGIELLMDKDGKTLSYSLISGGDSKDPTQWPQKNSISLIENALHCVQGEIIGSDTACKDSPDMPIYARSFKDLILLPNLDSSGTLVGAIIEVRQTEKPNEHAVIRLNLDGMLAASNPIEIVAQP
jgi:hypothetical protein